MQVKVEITGEIRSCFSLNGRENIKYLDSQCDPISYLLGWQLQKETECFDEKVEKLEFIVGGSTKIVQWL